MTSRIPARLRKLALLALIAGCFAAVDAPVAHAHQCSTTSAGMTVFGGGTLRGIVNYQCGDGLAGSITRTVGWQYYYGGLCSPACSGGSWVGINSSYVQACSTTVVQGPSPTHSYQCDRNVAAFVNAEPGQTCVRVRGTIVHVTTSTRYSQGFCWAG